MLELRHHAARECRAATCVGIRVLLFGYMIPYQTKYPVRYPVRYSVRFRIYPSSMHGLLLAQFEGLTLDFIMSAFSTLLFIHRVVSFFWWCAFGVTRETCRVQRQALLGFTMKSHFTYVGEPMVVEPPNHGRQDTYTYFMESQWSLNRQIIDDRLL